tara:strand:- start:104 stop:937 length:834 start_codon:yes stop_codon:yes gene_type:complete
MITLNYLVRKKSNISTDDFNAYWLGEHALKSIEIAHKMGVGRYTKCQTMHQDPANIAIQGMYGTATDTYDFVDQMVIGNLDDYKSALADSDVNDMLKSLHDASAGYVDFSASDYWLSAELPQLFPRNAAHILALPSNTFLKIIYVPRRLSHLSLQEAQLHWNTCHGGLARQYAEFLIYEKYVQAHRMDSSLVWQHKNLLNAEFENIDSIIGQAEAWLDRRELVGLEGPEVDDMLRMLGVDIELFVDPSTSHIFGTKEHVILSQRIINEPVPTLFTVD